MNRHLFRVTVDEPNYSNVLGEPLGEKSHSLLPDRIKSDSEQRIWAINTTSPAANTCRNQMMPGDGLLFYKVERGIAQDEKMYVGIGEIDEKFDLDAQVADQLFGTSAARNAFTVTNFHSIEKTVEDIKPVLGYEQHPQRTQRVKPDRYRSVESTMDELRG